MFEKKSQFLYPFYGGGDYGGGRQFCNIFALYYYGKMIQLQNVANFIWGSREKIFFKEALKSKKRDGRPSFF